MYDAADKEMERIDLKPLTREQILKLLSERGIHAKGEDEIPDRYRTSVEEPVKEEL